MQPIRETGKLEGRASCALFLQFYVYVERKNV